jgi:hypothetical protein
LALERPRGEKTPQFPSASGVPKAKSFNCTSAGKLQFLKKKKKKRCGGELLCCWWVALVDRAKALHHLSMIVPTTFVKGPSGVVEIQLLSGARRDILMGDSTYYDRIRIAKHGR